ncbi:hypothetical protein Tco_0681582 [Tanacetum coccineum]|uniref:Uncharacterized protein n=1 Tax=Tanacetum coccineum TaxID=301880 RepID=A0ABQ4XNR0_9ASTR
MNLQETQHVIARDEKWVPSTRRVKISPTNVRLETTVHQKEETFQVIIDVIKNSVCFKAFTASEEVPEIFMQQFWYTIKKILDICPRVEGEEFTEVQDDNDTLTFIIDLDYKGPLHKYTSMEIVDYPELIWEDFAFQIDHRKKKKSRHETDDGIVSRLKFVRIGEDYQEYGLPIPETMLTEEIKQSESYQMFIKYSTGQIHPKKSRGKGSQGKKTADTHVADVDVSEESDSEPARKRTANKRVIKKKVIISAADNLIPDLDVALELGKSTSLTKAVEEEAARQVHVTHARTVTESVPKPAKKKTGSRSTRGVFIQDTPSAPNPKLAALKLKLMGVQSLTLEEQEAAYTMQALKESKKTSRRQPGIEGSSEGTGSVLGVPDESIVVSANSSEGTESEYSKEDLHYDKEVDWIYSNEDDEKKDDADDNRINDDEDEEMTNAEVEKSRNGDAKIFDAAKVDAEKMEEIKDDAKKAELPPTSSSLSVSSGFSDQFLKLSSDTSLIGTAKDTTDAEINSLLDVQIQQEIPHIQSSSVLKVPVSVIYKPSVLTPIPETPLVAPVTTLPSLFVSTIPHVFLQTTAPIYIPPIIIDALTITTKDLTIPIRSYDYDLAKPKTILSKIPILTTLITTVVPESNALTDVQLRVSKLEKDMSELKKIDHSVETHTSLKFQVPTVVDNYLGSKLTPESSKIQTSIINLEQEFEKSASEIHKLKKEQVEKQKMPKYTIKSTNKAALK